MTNVLSDISIHALHEESDHDWPSYMSRGRYISIHALHEESDLDGLRFCSVLSPNFNPRSP